MLKNYIELIKPGIIAGNIVLIIGGFFLPSHSNIHVNLFLYTIFGTSFVIASACVFNNLIDYNIDQKMSRTKNRVLVKKLLKHSQVYIFGLVLGVIGFLILGFFVNILSLFLSIFGFFVYVFLYTYIFKRISVYSTLIGSFSGSIPSVIGYTAVSNTIDVCFFLLFITIIFWQMSHFYAIAIFRIQDYKNANIPVLPVVKNIFLVKKHIICYIIFFIIFTSLFTLMGYLSYTFLLLSFLINFFWLFLACYQFQTICKKKYSRRLFYFSIVVIIWFNFLIAIDDILHHFIIYHL